MVAHPRKNPLHCIAFIDRTSRIAVSTNLRVWKRSSAQKGTRGGRCFRLARSRSLTLLYAAWVFSRVSWALAADFTITQIADEEYLNRQPVISDTGLTAWHAFEDSEDRTASDIYVHFDGESRPITRGVMEPLSHNVHPRVDGNRVVWTTSYTNLVAPENVTWRLWEVPDRHEIKPGLDIDGAWVVVAGGTKEQEPEAQKWAPADSITTNGAPQDQPDAAASGRHPSGNSEIALWEVGGTPQRITADYRNDLAPDMAGRLLSWQKAKGWPFGWEIMAWNDGQRYQLTTNFYYDMAPQVHKGRHDTDYQQPIRRRLTRHLGR